MNKSRRMDEVLSWQTRRFSIHRISKPKLLIHDLLISSDLEIIINLLGTFAKDENPTDKIAPKFLPKLAKFTQNSPKMANFHLILAKITKVGPSKSDLSDSVFPPLDS